MRRDLVHVSLSHWFVELTFFVIRYMDDLSTLMSNEEAKKSSTSTDGDIRSGLQFPRLLTGSKYTKYYVNIFLGMSRKCRPFYRLLSPTFLHFYFRQICATRAHLVPTYIVTPKSRLRFSRRGRFGVCGCDFLQFEQLCQKVLLLYPSIKNAGCSRHQVSTLPSYSTASECMRWILGGMGMEGGTVDG